MKDEVPQIPIFYIPSFILHISYFILHTSSFLSSFLSQVACQARHLHLAAAARTTKVQAARRLESFSRRSRRRWVRPALPPRDGLHRPPAHSQPPRNCALRIFFPGKHLAYFLEQFSANHDRPLLQGFSAPRKSRSFCLRPRRESSFRKRRSTNCGNGGRTARKCTNVQIRRI